MASRPVLQHAPSAEFCGPVFRQFGGQYLDAVRMLGLDVFSGLVLGGAGLVARGHENLCATDTQPIGVLISVAGDSGFLLGQTCTWEVQIHSRQIVGRKPSIRPKVEEEPSRQKASDSEQKMSG
jgi:hypothetical protein